MSFDPYRKLGLAVLLAVSVALLMAVWHFRGCSQIGNAFSFIGGLVSAWPSVARLWVGRRYARAPHPAAPGALQRLDRVAERARRRRFLAFDVRDVWMTTIGIGLLTAGFALTILGSDGPGSICTAPPPTR